MQTQTTVTSNQFTLSLNDFWKGLIVAVISPVFTIIITSLNAGSLTFDWKAMGGVAAAAMLSYLLKNFLDSPKIVMTGQSAATMKAVDQGDKEVKVVNA